MNEEEKETGDSMGKHGDPVQGFCFVLFCSFLFFSFPFSNPTARIFPFISLEILASSLNAPRKEVVIKNGTVTCGRDYCKPI